MRSAGTYVGCGAELRQPRQAARRRGALLLVVGLILSMAAVVAVGSGTPARADTPVVGQVTRGNDTGRTNWYPNQPSLSPATVGGRSFGKLFDRALNGQIMAQPLVANGVLVVATENDAVYGLNPNNGAILWADQFGPPFDPAPLNCGDLVPNVGITSTPVIDTRTNTVYVVANEVIDGADQYRMHALDLGTGRERANFPSVIGGNADNRNASFDPNQQTQRPGLLLLDGVVYAAFSAHCQVPNWQGWVMGVNATSGAMTARWADHYGFDAGSSGGGIWMAGGGLASDGDGQILFAVGNALTPNGGSYGPGNPPAELSNAVVRLSVQNDGSLALTDFFVPSNENYLDANDLDLGSGGLALLPDGYFGTSAVPHLAVVSGKSGLLYLLNRDNLGGEQQGAGGGDAVVGVYGPNGGVWSQPSVWPGDGGYVYVPTASPANSNYGISGNLVAYKASVDGAGVPTLTQVAASSETWGFGSSSVMVTSNGARSGSALLWAVHSTQQGSGRGVPDAELAAYDPIPRNGDFVKVFSFPLGTANKFTPPAVGPNGQIYATTYGGHILGFGNSGPLSTTSVTFPATAVGGSSTVGAAFTARYATTLTNIAVSSGFAHGPVAVNGRLTSLPVRLNAGNVVSLAVAFTPSGAGRLTGAITATTTNGAVSATLAGTGVTAGAALVATPSRLDLGTVPIGGAKDNAVTVTNYSAHTVAVQRVLAPGSPFVLTGAPRVGSTIAPGGSVSMTVSFRPRAALSYASAVIVGTTGGTLTIPVAGRGGAPGLLTVTPAALNFGAVGVGAARTAAFTLRNVGGTPISISVSKPPAGSGFRALTTLGEGATLAPGAARTEIVRFAPGQLGTSRSTWQITATDSRGPHNIALVGAGVPLYDVAYQSDAGSLVTVGRSGTHDWNLGMRANTNPAVTQYGGGYEVAFQANTGSLWTVGTGGNRAWNLGMKAGTSPAITALAGGGYEAAFQANTGTLWTAGSAGVRNWGLGMSSVTSPAVSRYGAGYEVAFTANNGDLWTVGSAGVRHWSLGVWHLSSPSIAPLYGGSGYEVAFQSNVGSLWTVGSGGNLNLNRQVFGDSSPGIAP